MQQNKSPEKNNELYREVLSGFVRQGTSLNKFCEQIGELRQTAYKVLRFERNGKKAQELRKRLIKASTAQAITTAE
jgi:hypothetical protein